MNCYWDDFLLAYFHTLRRDVDDRLRKYYISQVSNKVHFIIAFNTEG